MYYKLLTISLLLFSSCSHRIDSKPFEVADAFLTAYFKVDFDNLLPLCLPNSELKLDMERNARSLLGERLQSNESNQSIEQRLNDLSLYRFKIENIQINQTKDSAFVLYFIFTPEIPDGIESRLTLIKVKEEEDWRVAKLL